jgi:hypothetical protein
MSNTKTGVRKPNSLPLLTQPQRSHNVTTTVYTRDVNIDNILESFRNLFQDPKAAARIQTYYPESRKGLIYKTGKYAKKTVNYFKKSETKAGILVATWIAETVAYALAFLVILSSGAYITAALWTALYTYISYSFFTMLKDAMVSNYILKGI